MICEAKEGRSHFKIKETSWAKSQILDDGKYAAYASAWSKTKAIEIYLLRWWREEEADIWF
ncbi:MAG TPA: hypothetical protein DIW24_05370 [Bacteroidetes bacterium]|nr:hypothetical protein [Bacteroidota bacterium]